METFVIKAIQLIFSLAILVIVHELGHFLFAKLFKIRVEKFYLFFNPTISLVKCKKINGKWCFKFFSKNLSNTETETSEDGMPVLDEKGKGKQKMIDTSLLPADDWRKYPENTEYGIGWLPLGGYVKIAGMVDESMDMAALKRPPQPWEFRTRPAWQRLFVMVGGALMNFIFAFFIYSIVVANWGDNYIPMDKTPLYFSETVQEAGFQDGDILLTANGKALSRYDNLDLFRVIDAETVTILRSEQEITLNLPEDFKSRFLASKMPFADFSQAIVDSVLPESNAEKAGLQAGDRIISINQTQTTAFAIFSMQLSKYKDSKVELRVIRGQDTLQLVSRVDEQGKLGFFPSRPQVYVSKHYNFFQSIPAGIGTGIRTMSFYVLQLKLLFSKAGISNIGGFGAIGNLFPAQWDWLTFWMQTALISIMLGVMNLLPVPVLDGGHVLFTLYEMITRRKPSDKFLENAQWTGLILLIALMVYANGMDVIRAFFR